MWVRAAVLAILAVGLAQSGRHSRMTKSLMDACFPIMPLEKLNSQPDRDMQIFTDFEFSCGGEIAAWNFYAGNAGHFYASVWRKHPDGRFEMVGKNYVEAKRRGAQTYFVPRHLRFRVNTGDLLGIHYESKHGRSVIMFEDDNKRGFDKKVKVSATISKKMYNKQLNLGHEFEGKIKFSKGKRAPSLFPVFNKNRLRIVGGKNEMEGRAEFFSNGQWGTICDGYFVERGWPDVFCKELGYDHCELSKFARKMYTGVGRGPIGYVKPACPLTGNIFMDECGKDRGTCGHNLDVFVRCAYSVKLEKGRNPAEGRAIISKRSRRTYKWGSICDKKPETQGWASALCHEIGYSHAVEAKNAKKTYVGKGRGSIMLNNPTCRADKPYHLKYCAKNGKRCSHNNDVFVKCQHGVRLINGKTSAEGIAQIFKKGEWGTVCMDKIKKTGFPAVFCKDLGYERVDYVSYAKDAYTKEGSGHIADMNPVCSPQDAANVLNCGHPTKNKCSHRQDVFIKCANNDMCKSRPCQNRGVCIDLAGDYKCKCRKGFTGSNCEQDIDECASNPCQGKGAKCINKKGSYRCKCPKGRTGKRCQIARLPRNPVTIRSYDAPKKNLYVRPGRFNRRTVSLSTRSRTFQIRRGLIRRSGAVSFYLPSGHFLVQRGGRLVAQKAPRKPNFRRRNRRRRRISRRMRRRMMKSWRKKYLSFRKSATFFTEESKQHPGYYTVRNYRKNRVLVHRKNAMRFMSAKRATKKFLASALFYFNDLDAQNSIIMYNRRRFRGRAMALTEDDDDLRDHGFNNRMDSFVINGNSAWQLFANRNYRGKSVIAQPGKYDLKWVRRRIGRNRVSSVRKVQSKDSLILWARKLYRGKNKIIAADTKNLRNRRVRGIEVVGPSSWAIYSKRGYKGKKIVVSPGRYSRRWIRSHMRKYRVGSARRVEVNKPMCSAKSGYQYVKGPSGKKHRVFLVHKEDGSVWMRFGKGNKRRSWRFRNRFAGRVSRTLINRRDIKAMKDFKFINWEVQSDLKLKMSVDNSWNPSNIKVMYLGSKSRRTLKFKNKYSDRTDITFAADKSQLTCTGKVKNGKVLSNLCGKGGLPDYGTASSPLAITRVYMNPRGFRAFAKNRNFRRNAFTFKGSYYYVYGKLADCSSSSGCYKRQDDVSYVVDIAKPKKDNRPDTFYFGQKKMDIDACEAACKNEPDCVAYTLYEKAQSGLKGGCYGVGKSKMSKPVTVQGAMSGKSVKCGTFIPEYMKYDMWTRNTTGCPCSFDTSRTDCACCYEGACQCESRYKYQCTLCGFSDRCGAPFLNTAKHEYIFEHVNQQLTEAGRHYKVPDLCVTGCEMEVRGSDSAASEVAAYMTDYNGDRVLSCVASGLDKSSKAIVHTEGATTAVEGSRINRVNLYAFGGIGQMVQLRLKINRKGCPKTANDERYIGCFLQGDKHENTTDFTFTSTHMSRGACVEACYNHGFKFAMLQKGTTCQCTNEMPAAGPAFTCDRYCSGDRRQVCGGMDAFSIMRTNYEEHGVHAVIGHGKCATVGGTDIGSFFLKATGDECKKMTGGKTSGSEMVNCHMSVCGLSKVKTGGLFPSRPGSCGSRKVGEAFVRTMGSDCIDMGGKPNYDQMEWGMCKLDLCTSNVPRRTIYTPVPVQTCPAYARVAEVEIETTPKQCKQMGGSIRKSDDETSKTVFCMVDFCMQDKDPKGEKVYTFPHNNEEIPEGSNTFYRLPKMCITECQFGFRATAEGLSIGGVTLYGDDKKEAGLFCGSEARNKSATSVLSFADVATGVMVSGLSMSAKNHSFILNQLKLHINPDGCKGNDEMLVVYPKPNFGGRPQIIRDDIKDLDTIKFNNRASSFKIYGNRMWELFENKDFKGRSAVFAAGEYYDATVLPFGNNDLSSVHIAGTMDSDMDATRKEMSNAKNLVCFKRAPKSSAVFGLSPNTPEGENRPRVFFFGKMGDDIDRCEHACRAEPQCAAFTLFSTSAQGELTAWRGLCYGRSFRDDVEVYQEDVISGYVSSCTQEDTLTLYTEKEFAGVHRMIIEDVVNITFSAGPLSAMVTGQDTWRVMTESDGHIHTYKLAPGEYSDISSTFTGRVFQVSKMHPNTQLYKKIHNQIDLAPVAFNQIQKTITEIRTKISSKSENKTETVCNTTKEAEVFFVIDASSSIFAHNYEKVLDFTAKVTESFSLGASQVRVGAVVYSFYTHLDIPLGTHTETTELKKAIKGLKYYMGGTYTDSALKAVREEGMTDAMVRPGVSKQAIVITDGKSRWPKDTAKEAHLCRDAGIALTAVGIKGADYEELHNIAGDASRVFNVSDFDQLGGIISSIEKTTCKAVEQGEDVWNVTKHVTITVQGDDSNYFVHEDSEFNRKPVALGMESGVIYNSQIFASSALFSHEAHFGRLNHNSGWMTTIGNHTNKNEWVEIDLGKILPIHGIATQGHGTEEVWVTKYKIAISLDGIHFVTFKDLNTTKDLIFIGNSDQSTIKYHCLHRLFGMAIQARVIRFIAVEWNVKIGMRIELYGFRDADDASLVEALRKDVWTRNVTGCPCYFDSNRKDCACCEDGGCQCPNTDRHQCVQCGYPHKCGTPSLRNPVNNIDGWTSSLSGCRCAFDPLRTDCACCQSYGCQCGGGNKNQCVNCGHPEHCGLKEHIFGPNPYCKPQTCPRKINTIWEGPAPTGVNPGDSNGVIQEIATSQVVKLVKNVIRR